MVQATREFDDRGIPVGKLLLGFIAGVVLLGALAELYLRLFPPQDYQDYRTEASQQTGIYRPDDDFAVGYRSWEAFQGDNAERLRPYLPLARPAEAPPTWAFFGNSFFQAPGMLADTARAAISNRRIFNLGRNEHLCVRMAQIKMLLAHDMQPDRIFMELMPVDLLSLGRQPLSTIRVTSQGALAYEPRLPPGPAGWLVRHSRLAWTAWCRAGQHVGNPFFRAAPLQRRIDEPLLSDVRTLFAHLARVVENRHVSVTVILIPSQQQIVRGDPFGFQDTVGPLLRAQGFDVLDPRDVFLRRPDREELYIADGHLSPAGNQLLLRELLGRVGTDAVALAAGVPPS
jgi:hypothetical protein